MRGNEFHEQTTELSSCKSFSIPMRGNESLQRELGQAKLKMFSIPMRGNEFHAQVSVQRLVSGFRSP